MSDEARISPAAVVQAVEDYVESELSDAARYDNREPLDESGIWSLHRLAAVIYAIGWADGERAAVTRLRAAQQRTAGRTE